MRRLLIIGCGDVIRRVLPELVRRWRVLALVRHHDPALKALGVRQITGDLDQRRSLRRLAGIADVVIHSAPPADDSTHIDQRTANLLATLRRSKFLPRQLTYISTTGVYGDSGGRTVTESHPRNATSSRAKRRLDAEDQLRQLGRSSRCHINLLRAPGIYAADRLPLDRLRKGLPLFLPKDDTHTNHIHALDLGRACIAALRRGRPCRAYNICDDSALAMGDWFDLLADTFGLPRAPRLSRTEVETTVTPLQWSFMSESRQIDNTRLKRELGYHLRYPTVALGIKANDLTGTMSSTDHAHSLYSVGGRYSSRIMSEQGGRKLVTTVKEG